MLFKQLVSGLVAVNSVMNQSFETFAYSISKRKCSNHKINILKYHKFGIKNQFLLYKEFTSEKLIPDVSRCARKNQIGIIVLGNNLTFLKNLTVITLYIAVKSRLAVVINIKLMCKGIKNSCYFRCTLL